MQKAKLSWLFIFNVFLVITLVVSLAKPAAVQSALASNIVISEIQLDGTASTDDFVELYNPTDSAINLGDFRLVKRTADATEDTSIAAFTAAHVIPAHGYFLWCNSGLSATLLCDSSTGGTVSNNNSVALRNGPLNTGAVVDAVTFGTVTNTLGEGISLTAPAANTSVERKANSSSTADSMTSGADVSAGNGEDTDNNANDFIVRTASQSQNTASAAETPGASPAPSPSEEPSSEPSESPSASPSASPSESPSASPSVSPSEEPSASPSVSPSANASASASISPSPSQTPKPKSKIVCRFEPQTIKFGRWEFTFHTLSCRRIII